MNHLCQAEDDHELSGDVPMMDFPVEWRLTFLLGETSLVFLTWFCLLS